MRSATKNNAILDRWAGTLALRGADAAVLGRDGGIERRFADIEAEAAEWEGRLAHGHYGAGAVLGVQWGNTPAWPALVLAAMRRGVVLLPIGLYMEGAEREAALETCRAQGLVTASGAMDIEPRRAAAPIEGCDFLKLTSGTTSQPRAIRFTAAQLAADCDNICETMGFGVGGEQDLNFGVIPFSHSYGFSNLITPLLCRGVPLVASEERMPRAILNDLARTGATVFPGMPVFYEKLADLAMNGPATQNLPGLPKLRLCISAGAPLPARVGQVFSERFGLKVHTFYGSSECGGIGYDAGGELVYEDGFVGRPMRNVEIAPRGDAGQIAVRGGAVGEGYFPEPDPETLGSGRFVPGDLVRMGGRGMYLAGRATDVINIAGRKLNPAEVEARLVQCPGVRQVVVFGVASPLRNEEAVACVSGSASGPEVLRFARTVLSGWQVPKDVWLVDEVPVNERGKFSRRDLARTYGLKNKCTLGTRPPA